MKAWLIRWNWSGDHAAVSHPFVSILSARKSSSYIQNYLQQLYLDKTASLEEILSYARYNKPTKPPYAAERVKYGFNCGHNPWLEAKYVEGLLLSTNEEGEQTLSWTEKSGRRNCIKVS
jgi:hypothetical protein